MKVIAIMKRAIETYTERNTQLGSTWYPVGDITSIIYPNGVSLNNPSDFAKFHILQWIIGKLVRFAKSGDIDSIHDAGVYCFILESIARDEASNNLSES